MCNYEHMCNYVDSLVTGCVNSVPNLSVTECASSGSTELTVHGLDFMSGTDRPSQVQYTHLAPLPVFICFDF